MKLAELLDQLDPDTRVKIGAVNGSSYFYLGSPSDFTRHYAYYNACVTSAARRAVDIAEREVLALRASKERTKRIKELRAQKEAKLLRAQSRYDTMTHIKDRDVVDWWESDETIEDNVTAIRVEGYEVGRFWCFADSKILPAVGC